MLLIFSLLALAAIFAEPTINIPKNGVMLLTENRVMSVAISGVPDDTYRVKLIHPAIIREDVISRQIGLRPDSQGTLNVEFAIPPKFFEKEVFIALRSPSYAKRFHRFRVLPSTLSIMTSLMHSRTAKGFSCD
jgi:hypothetical protein